MDSGYVCGDPVNNIDPTGTKNVGFDPENPEILQNVKDCKDGSDPEYSGSSFCKGFLAGFEKGDLTAYGFGFAASSGAGLSIAGVECPEAVWTLSQYAGFGGLGRAAVGVDPVWNTGSTFVLGAGTAEAGRTYGGAVLKYSPWVAAGGTVVDAVCTALNYYA